MFTFLPISKLLPDDVGHVVPLPCELGSHFADPLHFLVSLPQQGTQPGHLPFQLRQSHLSHHISHGPILIQPGPPSSFCYLLLQATESWVEGREKVATFQRLLAPYLHGIEFLQGASLRSLHFPQLCFILLSNTSEEQSQRSFASAFVIIR